ncbi:hypothetical protein [Flavobacterium sp. LS1P3]|uniref:hypothetical protein n=1 Tax=Flavobacterium sp. LS1P3 TaxID=3401720 RepID=UPI003AAB1FBC
MISSLLPIAVSWITYNSIWYPLAVIAFFSVVQALEAFIIFSFAVGSRLKKNTLVIIIVVIVGGILWGAAGIILFIPFNKYHKIDCRPHTKLKNVIRVIRRRRTKETYEIIYFKRPKSKAQSSSSLYHNCPCETSSGQSKLLA